MAVNAGAKWRNWMRPANRLSFILTGTTVSLRIEPGAVICRPINPRSCGRPYPQLFQQRCAQALAETAFRARVFPVCLNLSVAGVMELRSHAASICFPP